MSATASNSHPGGSDMDVLDPSALTEATRANAAEIEKLRARVHDHANLAAAHTALIEAITERQGIEMNNLDRKLDAIHQSLKDDLAEIKGDLAEDLADIKKDVGRVNEQGDQNRGDIDKLKGGLLVLSAGMPFLVAFVAYVFTRVF